jgi:hypothetical protein
MKLLLVFWNVENLFLNFDLIDLEAIDPKTLSEAEWSRTCSGLNPNKPLHKIKGLAEIILHKSPHLIMLSEVGGQQALDYFCQYFLMDLYTAHNLTTNSDRGIDLGYLVRRDSPFELENFNYNSEKLNLKYPGRKYNEKFARGVLGLRFFKNKKVFLQGLCVHLKSHLDKGTLDKWGFQKRKAEVEKLIDLYKNKLSTEVPTFLCGDFNGDASKSSTGQEFVSIYQDSDFLDVMDLAQTPKEKRFTHVYFRGDRANRNQLDYFFLNEKLQRHLHIENSGPYFFEDLDNYPRIPQRSYERNRLPSDHYPLFCQFDF